LILFQSRVTILFEGERKSCDQGLCVMPDTAATKMAPNTQPIILMVAMTCH
jgi:hypothetical protein